VRDVVWRFLVKYEWERAGVWIDPLRRALKSLVRVATVDLPQEYQGIVSTQFVRNGLAHEVLIDYSDYADINREAAERASIYFKMQYRRGGYDSPRVVPGGCVADSRQIYLMLAHLRRLRDEQNFAFDVYGRFSLDYAAGIRRRAVEMLTAQNRFAFEGGLKKVTYREFLRDITRARICIDLPGNGAFCHRLVNYLAIGACVVAAPHGSDLHVPLVNGQHIAYAKDDLSDLIDLCEFYLRNEAAREEMCRQSRLYFDLYLHPDNLAAYYVHSCLARA
jgi:hypothetical protein